MIRLSDFCPKSLININNSAIYRDGKEWGSCGALMVRNEEFCLGKSSVLDINFNYCYITHHAKI